MSINGKFTVVDGKIVNEYGVDMGKAPVGLAGSGQIVDGRIIDDMLHLVWGKVKTKKPRTLEEALAAAATKAKTAEA
jgi:hypothetical protein